MFYIKKTGTRYEVCLFGFKAKFRLGNSKLQERMDNLLYELADPRTLQNVKLPKILTQDDTLYTLSGSDKSMARYGDGEFKLMVGENISFQKYDPVLEKRLKEIIEYKNENLFIGIPDIFGYCDGYNRKVMALCRPMLYEHLDFSKEYIETWFVRRLKFATHEQGVDYYNKIKTLWNDKDIVIVEGAGSRLGVGNDLFSGTKSIERILCPIKDAFSKYDEILAECLKQPTNKLFVLALGPTATVLADDLSRKGYRALDIGHLDTAYEAFLRKAEKFVHVEGKVVFNEERHNNLIPPCKDENYNKQTIAVIN